MIQLDPFDAAVIGGHEPFKFQVKQFHDFPLHTRFPEAWQLRRGVAKKC
jgi:hypothetical protein